MAFENIRFGKPNISVYNGYFWMVDDIMDILVTKTDDGTQAFTYPFDHALTDNSVVSIEYDGYSLWTLENLSDDNIRIRRWAIDNYVVKLRNGFNFIADNNNKFDSEAMAVEAYEIMFASDESSGQQTLSVGDNSSGDVVDKIQSGYKVVLGPNSNGRTEEFTVSSAGSDYIVINGLTSFSYSSGDPIRFYRNIWMFNNYNGVDDSMGALYKISPHTGSIINKYPDNVYKDIKAATFFGVPYSVFNGGAATHPRDFAVCYIKSTNMIFMNPDDIEYAYGSLTMDNIEDDLSTIIPIYDVGVSNKNIYRLQKKATYYGSTSTFADNTYNYQLSTLNALINSISLSADPAILPADGESIANIKANVKDQFGLPIPGKIVYFTCDDPDGQILYTEDNTDSDGQATTSYKAGVEAREVRISATAQQG